MSVAKGGGLNGGGNGFSSGGGGLNGGGGGLNGGGGGLNGGGGGLNGGGAGLNGGGAGLNGGGGGLNGGGSNEITLATANSVTRPPRNLMVTSEQNSPRRITLQWTPPTFGQIGAYNIYRSADGGQTFAVIATVPGTQTTYTDTPNGAGPPCNATGYQYF